MALLSEAPLLNYFKEEFKEAQAQFIERSKVCLAKDPKNQFEQIKVGEDGDNSFHVLYLPAQKEDQLLVVQSGLHGIEGYTGSAIQNYLIDQLPSMDLKKTSILLIHGINAHGLKNNMRVNKNNVDLNRNLMEGEGSHHIKNDSFRDLLDFIQPQGVLKLHFFSKLMFYIEAIRQIKIHTLDKLRRALTSGQYQFSKAIFYGGKNLESEGLKLIEVWKKYAALHKKVFLIDLHTGYGAKNKLHIICQSSSSATNAELTQLFDPTPLDFGDTKHFYQTYGDSAQMFEKLFGEKQQGRGVFFEFGTLNSQSVLGSFESIFIMIKENQGRNQGYANPESKNIMAQLYKKMFYPNDPEWRAQVLQQADDQFKRILNKFEAK